MRHFWVFVAVVVLVAGGYFLSVPRTSVIEGRVVLHGLDGRETPGAGATVAVYSAPAVEGVLRQWSSDYEDSRTQNRLELQAARRHWTEMTARRDEAARILRVAEQANAADLEICRARHREAAADAEEALQRMEHLGSGLDESINPVRFLAALPTPAAEFVANNEGFFRAEVPGGIEMFLVAHLPGQGPGAETIVWLRRGRFDNGEKVQFSNAHVLTAEQLVGLARTQKGPGSPAGSPAE